MHGVPSQKFAPVVFENVPAPHGTQAVAEGAVRPGVPAVPGGHAALEQAANPSEAA